MFSFLQNFLITSLQLYEGDKCTTSFWKAAQKLEPEPLQTVRSTSRSQSSDVKYKELPFHTYLCWLSGLVKRNSLINTFVASAKESCLPQRPLCWVSWMKAWPQLSNWTSYIIMRAVLGARGQAATWDMAYLTARSFYNKVQWTALRRASWD